MYERSYMHRDTVSCLAIASHHEFIITGSVDGHVKFWKKQSKGIEFAKDYKAHPGPVLGVAVSADGDCLVSWSKDRTLKVFDVGMFDMIGMVRLAFTPRCAEWCFKKDEARARLAVFDAESGRADVIDGKSGSPDAIAECRLHRAPVTCARYDPAFNVVISTDTKGMIEIWDPKMGKFPEDRGDFTFRLKMETDLFCLAKDKTHAWSMAISPDGETIALVCADLRVRVLDVSSGHLRRVYNESLEASSDLQRLGGEMLELGALDFGHRMAVERDVHRRWAAGGDDQAPLPTCVFDESGHFLLFGSYVGIKVVNLVTNRVSRLLGKVENTERFIQVALYQGQVAASKRRKIARATADTKAKLELADPTLVATAFKKERFYLFTRREPPAEDLDNPLVSRDVFNEKPIESGAVPGLVDEISGALLPRGAVMHTNRGDVWIKLFPEECPRTVENFVTHARNGYYNGIVFHRVIKGFMVQTGDPLGDGTGGESIWGGSFPDEFHPQLRHDRAGTVSMANSGPNTNGSQFFITTVPTPWLDEKHTVFGRVVKGMDVVGVIERTKTNRFERPLEEIKIMDIAVKEYIDEGKL